MFAVRLAALVAAVMIQGQVAVAQGTAPAAPQPVWPGAVPKEYVERVLACMDDMLSHSGTKDIYVASPGVSGPDGGPSASRDTTVATLLAMSERSQAFHLIDYDTTQGDLNALFADASTTGVAKLNLPNYYIRGALAEVRPSGVAGAGRPIGAFTLDLNVGHTPTRAILPGASTRLALTQFLGDDGATRAKVTSRAGWSVELTLAGPAEVAMPARTLVELGLVEVVGRMTHTSYQDCLGR